MPDNLPPSTFQLGARAVRRVGYGAMQLAGPNVFGPPRDPNTAIRVLRAAVDAGVNHIDTSDLYGPHVTNRLIAEALRPYPADLVLATKVGMVRGETGSWDPAFSAADIERSVHDNLRNLQTDVLEVVNFRASFNPMAPMEGSIEAPLTALCALREKGLVRHIGLSNVTPAQIAEGRRLTEIVCVQNHYNLAHRADDALIDALAPLGIAYVPYYPLGGFTPLKLRALHAVACRLGATPTQVALGWLLHRSPNVLLIPGTASLQHLEENLRSGAMRLSAADLEALEELGSGA